MTGLSVLARGTFQEKLQWAFGLYDINGDGVITRDEMLDIIVAIYDLLGKMVEPSVDDATAKEHVHRIFDVRNLCVCDRACMRVQRNLNYCMRACVCKGI